LTATVLVVAGCGHSGPIQQDPTKSSPPEKREAFTTGGTTSKRRAKPPRDIVWVAKWKSADLSFVTEKDYSGRMLGVEGSIYEHGRPVGAFTADEAEAYKGSDQLMLTGHVTLTSNGPASSANKTPTSKEQETVLTCGRLEWDSASDLIRAKENVNVVTPVYSLGPFAELWANAKLDHFGTPDFFTNKAPARSNEQP
jgi:hypothetical protein